MTDDPEQQHRQALALFRYGLIADLIQRPPGTQGIYARLQEKAAIPYTIPGFTRTRVAPETLRDWLKRYRHGGFEALLPKPRSDRGRPRLLPQAIADLLVSIKEDHPKLSVPLVIREARASGHVPADLPLPPSTVHRLLTQAGLMCKDLNAPTNADRRRFAFAKAGELWMSDVMHGPTVFVGDRTRRKTYLIAFLDDATRVIPYAAFALAENTQAFLPVFKQALMRRGLPLRLYVDNGANYRSQHLALVCAKLGIALIHARAYLLTRLGYLVEEQGMTYLADPDPDNTLGPLQVAACTYRIAFGPRAGQKVLSLSTAAPAPVAPATAHRCVEAQGFSLHAETRLAINQRHKLEQLCRYITRPAIANERLAVNPAG